MARVSYDEMAAVYDEVYSFKNYRKDADKVRAYARRYCRSRGLSLLDVACGTGLHLEHLGKHFAVEGVDLSPQMLRVARKRLGSVPLHKGDFRNFDLHRQFDVVTCLSSSIGYARTMADLRKALKRMAAHLKPGGVLVLEPWLTPENTTDRYVSVLTAGQGDRKIARISYTRKRGRRCELQLHHVVADKSGAKYWSENHLMGLFTTQEYEKALYEAGLWLRAKPKGFLGRGMFVATRPVDGPLR